MTDQFSARDDAYIAFARLPTSQRWAASSSGSEFTPLRRALFRYIQHDPNRIHLFNSGTQDERNRLSRLAEEHVIGVAVITLHETLDRLVDPNRLSEVWNAIELQLNILAGLDYNQYPAITVRIVPALERLHSQLQTDVGLCHHAVPLSCIISRLMMPRNAYERAHQLSRLLVEPGFLDLCRTVNRGLPSGLTAAGPVQVISSSSNDHYSNAISFRVNEQPQHPSSAHEVEQPNAALHQQHAGGPQAAAIPRINPTLRPNTVVPVRGQPSRVIAAMLPGRRQNDRRP